jgi:hypothetical protein
MRALHAGLIGFGIGGALLIYGIVILTAAAYALGSGRATFFTAAAVVFLSVPALAMGTRMVGTTFEIINDDPERRRTR